jgi:hypothetical protein
MASVRAATAQDAVTCAAIVVGLPDFFTDDVPDKGAKRPARPRWLGHRRCRRRRRLRHRAAPRHLRGGDPVAAIAADRLGAGLGTRLVNHVLDELSADGVQIVEVKTLDPSADCAPTTRRVPSGSLAGHSARHHRSAPRLAAGQTGGDPRRRTRPDAVARAHRVPLTHRRACGFSFGGVGAPGP